MAHADVMAGGCECGAVRYRLRGAPHYVNACHCRQCQKISGSAFGLNAMVDADQIELTQGRPGPLRTTSDLGTSTGWRCEACGVLLWADHPKMPPQTRFLRVGSLDEGERLSPSAHFFVRSKHPWIVVPAGVPTYETLPDFAAGETLSGYAGETPQP